MIKIEIDKNKKISQEELLDIIDEQLSIGMKDELGTTLTDILDFDWNIDWEAEEVFPNLMGNEWPNIPMYPLTAPHILDPCLKCSNYKEGRICHCTLPYTSITDGSLLW